jgi:type VI protein secretion system component VasK
MLPLILGAAVLLLFITVLRGFERASVTTIKSLLAWIAAIGGITLVGLAAAVLAHDRRNTGDEQSSARARESPG